MSAPADHELPADFPANTPYAPAPWPNLKSESLCLFTTTSASTSPTQAAWYSPLEANSSFADSDTSGKFLGGLAMVMLVRYTETPAGPYDELLWVPGKFQVPRAGRLPGEEDKEEAEEKLRVTRIYVSTKASTVNGRRNWNIPKTLARFNFVPAPPGSTLPYSRIEVLPYSSTEPEPAPFFAVNITPVPLISRLPIPFSSVLSPIDLDLVQPPLPGGDVDTLGEVERKRWRRTKPWLRGSVSLAGVEGGLEGKEYGDGVGWGKEKYWSYGAWWRDFWVDFGVGKEGSGEE